MRTLTAELTFTQKLASSMGSPSMISSGKVTSKGSGRDSNGPSEGMGRATLPRTEADNPRKARLNRPVPARVTATGSWKFNGMLVTRRFLSVNLANLYWDQDWMRPRRVNGRRGFDVDASKQTPYSGQITARISDAILSHTR